MILSWYRQTLHLREPFTIARGSESVKQTIVVQIQHDGTVGLGEVVPTAYYGQDLPSAEKALQTIAGLLGDDPFCLQRILDTLLDRFDDQLATVAGIDAALHDWIGRRLGLPVWRLLGLDPTRSPLTSFTIGIDQPQIVARKVRQAASYPILKVKLGTPDDQQILAAVRRHAHHKLLRVDANAAWSLQQAPDRLRQVAAFGVEFVEQPIPPGAPASLAALRQAGIVPIVADESCVRPADVVALAGCVDGVNIKLSKCGGLRQALKMIHLARGLGLKVMLGCMVQSSLGIAAAAQLAPLADWLDLDGHLLLANDPFVGIGGHAGRLDLSNRPGLGVRPR